MSLISLVFDNPTAFDTAVHGGLPEGRNLRIITKPNGTESGHPIAVLTFTVQMPDKSERSAQAVVTVGNLMMALAALKGRYPHLGDFSIVHPGGAFG